MKIVLSKFWKCSLVVLAPASVAMLCGLIAADERPVAPDSEALRPSVQLPTVGEARVRAQLLHETIHGTLQVVHRDLFNDDDSSAIPSASMEDVFVELKKSHDVTVEWLVVDTDVVNVDHVADEPFEKDAVAALKKGEESYESIDRDMYHYVGRIHLASQCLKCHVKLRTDVNPRAAGLAISMPVGVTGSRTTDRQ